MATKLEGAQVSFLYSNSNGTAREELVKFDIDVDFPGGWETNLESRRFLENLVPVTSPSKSFGPMSKLLMVIDIDGSTNVTLDKTSKMSMPCRRKVFDAPGGQPQKTTLTLKDFIKFDGSNNVLQPGTGKNVFELQMSMIEEMRLGIPSSSPMNKNNSTFVIDLKKA